jgi:hypothetical protein
MTGTGMLLVEGAVGLPTVICLGVLSLRLRKMSASQWKERPIRCIMAMVALAVGSAGVLGFLASFIEEFYVLQTCSGSGCAQAGLGTFILVPVAWLSLGVTWLGSRGVS